MRHPGPPIRGELTLHPWRNGSNRDAIQLRADMMAPNRKQALSPMIDAVVVRITAEGIVIQGTELVARNPESSKSNVEYFRQTWWCRLLPCKMELLPEEPEEIPAWRRAQGLA